MGMSDYAYVYIMASQHNGTLYVGVTTDLKTCIWKHMQGVGSRFTARDGVKTLVFFVPHKEIDAAIARKKAIKNWKREWKLKLIESQNQAWRDLFFEIAKP